MGDEGCARVEGEQGSHPSGFVVFAPYVLDRRAGRLTRGADVIPVRAKTFAVLSYLLEHPGALVTKDELFRAIWSGIAVSDETLAKSISELRQALGDDARTPRFIETVHRRGFRFIADVQTVAVVGQTPMGDAATPAARDVRHRPSYFTGRAAERRRIEDAFRKARGGKRQMLFVTGEAGIGKTALVEEFLASDAVQQGCDVRVAWGHCVEQTGAREAYLPVLEALERLARRTAGGDFLAQFRRRAPAWLALMPWLLEPADAAELRLSLPEVRPERMLRELAVFLETITAAAPLILVLEDLHWSDPSTVELLLMLGQRREPAHLLVLGTYRPAEAAVQEHPLLQAKRTLQLRHQCDEIALAYLSREEVDAYFAQRFGSPGHPKGLTGLVHQHTDGNPLFVLAVVDQLLTRGWLVEKTPGWALTVPLPALQIDVPDDLRDMIRAQFRAVGPADASVLEVAAVSGDWFTAGELAGGLGGDRDHVGAVCERLVWTHRFLRIAGTTELPDGCVARRYAFIHALYQRVVYGEIPEERRQRLHRQVGLALEQAYGEATGRIAPRLAYHFEAARDYGRAIDYLAAAARTAQERSAAREAVASLDRALALLPRLRDADERRRREIALRLSLGAALNLLHGYASDEVRDNGVRARALCEQAGRVAEMFEATYSLWYSQALRAEPDTTIETARELAAVAERLEGTEYRLRAAGALGRTALYGADYCQARDALQEIIEAHERGEIDCNPAVFGAEPIVAAYAHHGEALYFLGCPDGARRDCLTALSLAERGGAPFTLAAAHTHAALIYQFRRERAEAFRLADRAVRLATEHGFPIWHALALGVRGWALMESGAAGDGLAQMREAAALLATSRANLARGFILALIAEGCLRFGEPAEGLAAVEEGLHVAQTTLDRWYEPEIWRLKGELRLAQAPARREPRRSRARGTRRLGGSTPDAEPWERCFQQAVTVARERQAKSLQLRAAMSLARWWASCGKHAEARRLVEPVLSSFTEGFETRDLRDAQGMLRTGSPTDG